MSPIFVRPVREQLEHDRLIRFLQPKYVKRTVEVAINVGDEQLAPVKIGPSTFFPDLVLTSGKKLEGLVEVESGESVNNLEAMSQWVHFAHARVPFHLYVPVHGYDAARRLCDANHVRVAEVWTYRATFEGFDLVKVFADASSSSRHAGHKAAEPKPSQKPAAKPVQKAAEKKPVAKKPAPKKAAKPVARKAAPAKKAPAKAKKAAPAAKKNASKTAKGAAGKRKR